MTCEAPTKGPEQTEMMPKQGQNGSQGGKGNCVYTLRVEGGAIQDMSKF